MAGKFGSLTHEHRYQIGNAPVTLTVSMVNGTPRLSFTIVVEKNGVTGTTLVHLATFKSEDTALAVVEFMDSMLNAVNQAVEHYEQLAKQRDITQLDQLLQAQERRNGSEN